MQKCKNGNAKMQKGRNVKYQPELFTFTLNVNWQLLKEHRQVRLSRTTFYGVDWQAKGILWTVAAISP